MQGAATRREVGAFLACFEVVSVIGSQESDQATYHVTRVATVPGLPEMPVSLVMKVIFNYTDQTSRMCPFEYEEWVLYHLPPSSLLLPFHGSFCDVLDERSISHCFMPNMRTDLNLESSNVPPESEKQTEATEPLDNKNTASSDETTTSDIRPFIGTPFEALSQRGFIPPSILSQAINGGVPVKCFLYSFLNSLSDTQYQGMPAGHLIDFIVKMLQCLHFLHTNFVFHTTLRPNSFFVTPDSTLQIGGFDRADVLTVNSVESGPRTATSLAVPCSLCGIVHPSQCSSSSLSDQATLSKIDLWSVGTIVFYLVLGRQYTQEDRHLPLSETIPSTYFPEPAHLLEKLLNKDINMRPTVLATLIDLGIKEAPPLDISRCTPCTAERLTTEAIATLHTPQARVLLEESLRLDETFIPAILALRAMRLYFPRNFNWPSADAVFKDHTGMLNRRAQNAPQEAQKQAEHFFSRESSSLACAEAANVASIAASRGYAPAQAWLGVCYEHGSGVKKDIEEAARLYQCAADQNLAQGQCWLGVCYENGRGVEKNVNKAVQLYMLAASEDQGLAQALCCLGVCYENGVAVSHNPEEAVRLYRLAAERGLARALCCLGVCYANGKGVQKDIPEAVKFYKLSAENGAQFYLAQRHEVGDGIPKDTTEAIKLYALAADQGHGQSLMRLGICYENGHGVCKDIREAVRLWKYAIDQGAVKAVEHLNLHLNYSTTTQQPSPQHTDSGS